MKRRGAPTLRRVRAWILDALCLGARASRPHAAWERGRLARMPRALRYSRLGVAICLAALVLLLSGCGLPFGQSAAPAAQPSATPTIGGFVAVHPASPTAVRPAATRAAQPTATDAPHIAPTATLAPTTKPAVPPTATKPAVPTATATATPLPSATPTRTPVPSPTPLVPRSWLATDTLLTIYGRGFGIAPILGRLGIDNNFADLDWQIQPYAQGIKAYNGGRETRVTIHLIYGMAVPCDQTKNCLYYLDDAGVDIVKQYIEPAAQRHWLVILDTQLGLSDPVTEARRMIAKGYLKYDNVELALDPEFRTAPGQPTPGIPIGSVTAEEINATQAFINAYSYRQHLPHRKVLIVHQFRFTMIQNREQVRSDYPWVDPVIVADGFGSPGVKADVYTQLLGPTAPRGVRWRGLKLFLPNPYETTHHTDDPPMTWRQVFGLDKTVDYDGSIYYIRPAPNVIVIA